MQKSTWLQCSALAVAIIAGGCGQDAPPQSAVPINPGEGYVPHDAPPKPMPDSATNDQPGPGPYDDSAILQQRLPQEQEFLDAYVKVHTPRIAVYVNRTLTGQMIPPNPGGPTETDERTQHSTGGVNVTNSQFNEHDDAYSHDVQSGRTHFQSNGPAEYTETTTHYVAPSDIDEADARSLDYDALEKILTDWMSCDGRVHMISSDYIAAQMSPADLQAMSEGKAPALTNLGDKVGADVLIQVQAHPTRQSGALQIRLVAQAINVRGGDLIGTAVVDVPLPLDKPRINTYTRFIAAKLMDGMSGAWESYSGGPPPQSTVPPQAPPSSSLPPVQQQSSAPLPAVPPASTPPASQPSEQMNFIP